MTNLYMAACRCSAKHMPFCRSDWPHADMQITNDTCSTLASLTDLQALDLRNHDELGEEGLLHLSLLSRLTCLRLANHRGLTDMGLRGISTLRALRSLQLTYSLGQPAWLELFTAGSFYCLISLTPRSVRLSPTPPC